MMGRQIPQNELFSYHVDLERRVRAHHPLRRIHALLDGERIRQQVRACYGYNGNESVDPAIIMKLLLLLFLDDVPSERELMRIIPERLDYLWFLGYGLDDAVPDHSVLSKARKRWGVAVFEALFVEVVGQCVQAGLVDGKKLHLDGSLVDAHASNNSVVQGSPELIAALKSAYQATEQKLDERTPYYAAQNERLVSTTDPDATVVRKGPLGPRPRYKNHRVVDDAHGVITAVETTTGAVAENHRLLPLVAQHERNTAIPAETVVADRQYGTAENFRACQERGLNTHMGDLLAPQKDTGRRAGIFAEADFVYDPLTDSYQCPAGQSLIRRKHKTHRAAWDYAASAATCRACPLRAQCTRSQTARSVKRHEGHELIQRGRAQAHSTAAYRDRRRRKWLMEGSFADAANNHGFKRARWRRLWRQQIQDFLIATVQNIRILLRQRPAPLLAAAGALVQGLRHGIRVSRPLCAPIFQCFYRCRRAVVSSVELFRWMPGPVYP
jgi:transposase